MGENKAVKNLHLWFSFKTDLGKLLQSWRNFFIITVKIWRY